MQSNLIRVLTRSEIEQVVRSLSSRKSSQSATNLMLFRLSCQVGLRRKEIAGLDLRDCITSGERPVITVRAITTKADRNGKRKKRHVPLWWDRSTREALADWKAWRTDQGAVASSPFICMGRGDYAGNRLTGKSLAKRWKSALKILGPERISQLSIHTGRRSYVSHCLTVGRSLAEVAAACGHQNIVTTNQYVHLIESGNLPDVFQFIAEIGEN